MNSITVTFTGTARDRAIGKLVAILLLALVAGAIFARDNARDRAEGERLTMEAYVAEFEAHKAKLKSKPASLLVGIATFALIGLVSAAVYELLASAASWSIGRLTRPDTQKT